MTDFENILDRLTNLFNVRVIIAVGISCRLLLHLVTG